jgi:hypothetical protein
MTDDPDTILLAVTPSASRRALGAGSLAALGVILVSVGFEAQALWSLVFLVCAILAFVGAWSLWKSTADSIELTETHLRTSSGRILTPVANVAGVDRGVFAFKPSNGFLVKLKDPIGKGWSPGLWWRRGRYLGVGGVLPGGQTRAMAEILTALHEGTWDELKKLR